MGERLQRRIAPRPQSQPSTSTATRHITEPPKGKVSDLTAESSSEDSLITSPQLELVEAPVTTPQGLAPAVVTSKAPVVHPLTNPASTSPTGAQATPKDPTITLQPQISGTVPQAAAQGTRWLLAMRRVAIPPPNLRATPTDLLIGLRNRRGFMAFLVAI